MFSTLIEKIRNAVLGREVKNAIADTIQMIYEDGISAENTAVEVIEARGKYPNLKDRLNFLQADAERLYGSIGEIDTSPIVFSADSEVDFPSAAEINGAILIVYEE